jgi:hypothetical protein
MTEFDLTTNRVPFGLLTDDEQNALKAWPHGWEYCWKYHGVGYWHEADNPSWIGGNVYRGKPAAMVKSLWQNLYPDGSHAVLHLTRKIADERCSPHRIAVIRIDTCNGVSTAHLENV